MFSFAKEPKSVFQLMGDAFRLFKSTFKKLWPLLLIYILSWFALMLFSALGVLLAIETPSVKFFVLIPIILLYVFVGGFMIFWLFNQMYELAMHQKIDYLASAKPIAKKTPRVIFVVIASVIAFIIIPLLIALLPSVIPHSIASSNILKLLISVIFLMAFFVYLYFALPAAFVVPLALLENQGFPKTIKSSFTLVKGKWWRTFFLFFMILIPIFILNHIERVFSDLPIYVYLFIYVLQLLGLIFFKAGILVAYNDLKLRKMVKG